MTEIWKDVVGYEGVYEVSNKGRVRSKERHVLGKNNCYRHLQGKILKERINKYGYNRVALNKNGITKNKLVHRLVLESFSNKSDKIVNHINGKKDDNRIENLEHCTYKENSIHAVDIGLIKIGTRNKEKNIVSDYKNGCRFSTLIKKYNTTYYQLKKVLEENDVSIESRGLRRRKFEYNDEDIFYLLNKGMTEKEVAKKLNITRNVVSYRKSLKRVENNG
ncbi:NUMOD4 domain-containing protein [Staphylococcus sp. GDY8P19P]|uniref:NUMOD4 domain-containing protein n=1 Tax=Staphylococcus sp. GDY8P19P TaxID=2804415 RepID=UPI00195071B6|nr:NUMOD4 domain-containing protein [Staphylococcus sp. GDY8P19P]